MKMHLLRCSSLPLIFALFLLSSSTRGRAQTMAPEVKTPVGFVTLDAFEQARRMGRGVNVLGYDPIWKDFSQRRFQPEYFAKIRAAGFQSVRVNLQAFQFMDASGKLPEAWFRMTDWILANATANHLQVILDEHDFNLCSADPDVCKPKLDAFWRQVAARYADAPNNVVFELLNEPHGAIDEQRWNLWLVDLLGVVRASNPTRNVVIGAGHWNSFAALKNLELPDDDGHIIVTFHYYQPMKFTHQGAKWVFHANAVTDIDWGTPAERFAVEKDFDGVAQWGRIHQRPIWLGEFGVYNRALMERRARWTSFVRQTAESRGFCWAYWQFDSNFEVYDVQQNQWVQPLLDALIPGSAQR